MPTYKVHVQRFVEQVATVEIEADTPDAAARIADSMKHGDFKWEPGDDAHGLDAYAVANAADEIVWER